MGESIFAITPRTQLANGASAQVHDYHCVCKKLSNATGKDVLVPWKTLAEWTAYYTTTKTGLTSSGCAGVFPGHPTLAIPDYNDTGNACAISTGTFAITGTKNSGGYDLRIAMPAAFFSAGGGCSATLWKTNGGAMTSTALVSGVNTITMCDQSEFYIYFACMSNTTHGPHNIVIEQEGGMLEIDDFNISFTTQSGCVF
ncbi:MAG: hypothetical protein KDD37_05875 [Bdellovibrionales bacterium]|nr:hypothetical protein [Bdellovibrionales bacterium]